VTLVWRLDGPVPGRRSVGRDENHPHAGRCTAVTSNRRSSERRAANRACSTSSTTRVRARPIVPGTRYKVTRRCFGRQFLLVPSLAVNEVIGYWLGVCLERHGLELHSACFMSNHYHLDVTDPLGTLPAFKNHFNAVLARALNALRGRFDKFWRRVAWNTNDVVVLAVTRRFCFGFSVFVPPSYSAKFRLSPQTPSTLTAHGVRSRAAGSRA